MIDMQPRGQVVGGRSGWSGVGKGDDPNGLKIRPLGAKDSPVGILLLFCVFLRSRAGPSPIWFAMIRVVGALLVQRSPGPGSSSGRASWQWEEHWVFAGMESGKRR